MCSSSLMFTLIMYAHEKATIIFVIGNQIKQIEDETVKIWYSWIQQHKIWIIFIWMRTVWLWNWNGFWTFCQMSQMQCQYHHIVLSFASPNYITVMNSILFFRFRIPPFTLQTILLYICYRVLVGTFFIMPIVMETSVLLWIKLQFILKQPNSLTC